MHGGLVVKNLDGSSLFSSPIGICCRLKYSAPYLPIAKFVVRSSSKIFSAATIYPFRTLAQAALSSFVPVVSAAAWDTRLRSLIAFERSTAVGLLPKR